VICEIGDRDFDVHPRPRCARLGAANIW